MHLPAEPTKYRRTGTQVGGESMAFEKIVAVYDKTAKARDAMRALESAGFMTSDISLLNRDALTKTDVNDAGLWRRLFGHDIGDNQSSVYSRAIESGGAVLSL